MPVLENLHIFLIWSCGQSLRCYGFMEKKTTLKISTSELRWSSLEPKLERRWMLNIELTGRGKEKNTESIHRCSEGWCNEDPRTR